jgi:hypothetical protein
MASYKCDREIDLAVWELENGFLNGAGEVDALLVHVFQDVGGS